jgi:membrane-associated phospholipid phosphatase
MNSIRTLLRDNLWFFIPFALWVVVGALLFAIYGKVALFMAVNQWYSPTADVIMRYTTFMGEAGFYVGIGLLFMLLSKRFRNRWYFIAALSCGLLSTLPTQILKNILNHPRPMKFFPEGVVHTVEGVKMHQHLSFPSGHTTGSFSLFVFLTLILPPRYKWLGLPFFFLALLCGYSRMYLGQHFYEDVYAGSIIGTIFTVLIFLFVQKRTPNQTLYTT